MRTKFRNSLKDKALLELSDVKNENTVLKKQLELSNIKFNDLSKQFNSHLLENSKKYMEVMGETNDLLKLRPKESKTKSSNYIHVPSYTKSLSECNPRTVGERSAKLLSFLSVMSNNSEKDRILTHFFNSNSNISLKSYQSSNLDSINHKLTPEAVVDLKLLLNIPVSKMRQLRTFLGNHLDMNIFPSEKQMRSDIEDRIDSKSIESGTVYFKETRSSEKPKFVPYAQTSNLHRAIHQSYLRLKEAGRLQNNSHFNDEVWLKIGSDKGGNCTKLVFEIANSVAPNSVRNTELINMFEATDSFDNIHKMFLPFAEQISNLNFLSFSENERIPVRKFGDYHFL